MQYAATPQTDPDGQALMKVLTDLGAPPGDAYNATQGVRNMASQNVTARLEAKIESFGAEIRTEIGSLSAKVDRLEGAVEGLAPASQVDALTSQVQSLTSQVESHGFQLQSLTSQMESQGTQLQTLTSTVQDLGSRMAVLVSKTDVLYRETTPWAGASGPATVKQLLGPVPRDLLKQRLRLWFGESGCSRGKRRTP